MITLSTIDLIALTWFLICWLGYSFFVYLYGNKNGNLYSTMFVHRLEWMNNLNAREDRVVDVASLGNIMRVVTFFASTSLLIVAALIPLISYGNKGDNFLENIPFVVDNSSPLWEIKSILLIIIFIYAFFKYSWALRQYSYASVIIVSGKIYKKPSKESNLVANRNAKILTNAARHFSMGVRGFYFGLAELSWFIHPVLFLVMTTLVVAVIFRREFMSRALGILSN